MKEERRQVFAAGYEADCLEFLSIELRKYPSDWIMAGTSIRTYEEPRANTRSPLEYAFYLLGEVARKTVVDLGCGDGVKTVILASLGAKVIAVDASNQNLEVTAERARANGIERNVTPVQSNGARIPVADSQADRVLCAGGLHHLDCVPVARQIRRVLKPGGTAAFVQPVMHAKWLWKLRTYFSQPGAAANQTWPLTREQIDGVSRAVGRSGRQCEFGIADRVLALNKSCTFDQRLLRQDAFANCLSSPIVWEARKES